MLTTVESHQLSREQESALDELRAATVRQLSTNLKLKEADQDFCDARDKAQATGLTEDQLFLVIQASRNQYLELHKYTEAERERAERALKLLREASQKLITAAQVKKEDPSPINLTAYDMAQAAWKGWREECDKYVDGGMISYAEIQEIDHALRFYEVDVTKLLIPKQELSPQVQQLSRLAHAIEIYNSHVPKTGFKDLDEATEQKLDDLYMDVKYAVDGCRNFGVSEYKIAAMMANCLKEILS